MDLINYSVSDKIAVIQMNRPDKRNSLSPELVDELKAAFNNAKNDTEVSAIIFTGSGNTFSAGADLQYLQSLQSYTREENLEDSRSLAELFRLIYELPKPVIAKVNGHAIAGGCGLVTVCDFAFAVPEAKFSYSEVRIGFVPAIVSTFLIRKCGEGIARDLLLSARTFTPEQAKDYRLINEVYSEKNLDTEVESFAHKLISRTSGTAVAMTKKLIREISGMPLQQALDAASVTNAEARLTPDCKKGIAAFLNKESKK